MRQIFLSTLLCLAGYTGAHASNEVVNDLAISQERQIMNFEAVNIDAVDKLTVAPNCFVKIEALDMYGVPSFLSFEIEADNEEDCHDKANQYIQVFELMGYTILSVEIDFP
jgi:stage V sporulation protein SpoVS